MLNRRGFTLLEMLVAMTIFAMLTVILYEGYYSTFKLWSKGEKRIYQIERMKNVFLMIRKQIISIYPVQPVEEVVDENLPEGAVGVPRANQPPFFRGNSQNMMFVTMSPIRINSISGLSLCLYRVEPSENGGLSLVEYESQYTGSVNLTGGFFIPPTIKNYRNVLLDGLESINFKYYGKDLSQVNVVPRDRIKKEWYDSWEVVEKSNFPSAVKISFLFKPDVKTLFKRGDLLIPIRSEGLIYGRIINYRGKR